MGKIEHIANIKQDATLWSVEDALNDALSDIGEKGAFKNGKKVLVIALDDQDGKYSTSFTQAGMTLSECISLMRVMETVFLREMGMID